MVVVGVGISGLSYSPPGDPETFRHPNLFPSASTGLLLVHRRQAGVPSDPILTAVCRLPSAVYVYYEPSCGEEKGGIGPFPITL